MKSLNMIALVATVAVVAACSNDEKKGAIITPKDRANVNRTADSKGKIPGTSSKAELAAAKNTVEASKEAAPAAQPTLTEAGEASYKLLVEAGSQAYRSSWQESQGNEELSMAAARDAIIAKVNEIGAANPEAVALALVMIGDAKVAEAFYQGKNEDESAHLAKFNADNSKVLNELSAKIKTDWETKKSEVEAAYTALNTELAKLSDEVKVMQKDIEIEQAKEVAEQDAVCISTNTANIETHNQAIKDLNINIAAHQAWIKEYTFLISQIDGVQTYVATRVQAVTPADPMTPADPETPADPMNPETPEAPEAPEAPADGQ